MSELLHPNIIKSYDIRGIWEEDLLLQDIDLISSSFANYILHQGGKMICMARDGRMSSEKIHHVMCVNFIRFGLHIIDLGLVPTPLLYLTMHDNDIIYSKYGNIPMIGFMITGSHNPPDHNGIKIMLKKHCLEGKKIKSIVERCNGVGTTDIQNLRDTQVKFLDGTLLHNIDLIKHYVERIVKSSNVSKFNCLNLKIAWDPGNGAVSIVLPVLFSALQSQNVLINDFIDPEFRYRSPNPLPENLLELRHKIMNDKCAFGFAFDGDGDRIVMVMNSGRILTGGELLYIIACDMINRIDHLKVIVDVKMSQRIIDQLKNKNIDVILSPSGHSIIKNNMSKLNVILAGEMSGHIYCGENYYCFDDPLFLACKIITIHQNNSRFIEDRINELGVSYLCEHNVQSSHVTNNAFISLMRLQLARLNISYCDIDGIRCVDDEGYWLIRNSNTESLLTILVEARTKEKLYKIWSIVYKILLEAGKNLKDGDLFVKIKNLKKLNNKEVL